MRIVHVLILILVLAVSGCVVTTTETTSQTIGLEPGGGIVKRNR
jgi:hypothetical protein